VLAEAYRTELHAWWGAANPAVALRECVVEHGWATDEATGEASLEARIDAKLNDLITLDDPWFCASMVGAEVARMLGLEEAAA
jgi:hypothetical protein